MEAGDVVWLLIILFWIFSSFVSWLRKNLGRQKSAEPKPAPPAPQRAARTPPRPGVAGAAPPPAQPTARRPPPPPPPPAQRAPSPEDALATLLKRLGVDIEIPSAQEQPVPAEHAHTPGWHERTPSEIRPTAGEHALAPSWHERTASEIRPTASERTAVASEHRVSASEHLPGDVERSGVSPAPGPRLAAPASGLGRRMIAELRNRDSLARAIVLKEILGPPVGLRTTDDRI